MSHPSAAATFPTLLLKASDMQSQQHTAHTSIKVSETKRPAPHSPRQEGLVPSPSTLDLSLAPLPLLWVITTLPLS